MEAEKSLEQRIKEIRRFVDGEQKPVRDTDPLTRNNMCKCPGCGYVFGYETAVSGKVNYCMKCGVKIDWSEANETD